MLIDRANAVGVVGVGQDITSMKEAEKERDLVAKDLEMLIDRANAPIFGIDKDGAVNEWNQTASAITGYTREEVFGQNLVKNYITPEYQDAVDEVLTNALRGTDTANFEFPLFTKDGRRVEILLNASSRRDVSGNVVGVVGVGHDITSIKEAEKERDLVAKDLEMLIDRANAPIFGIDKDGAVNEWNQTASAITGYTREEVFGQNLVKKYINPENQDAVDEVLTNALRGTDTANFEFPLFTKDGRRVEILLIASSRRDVSGNVVGVVGVGQDITSMKEAEKERDLVAKDLEMLIDRANAPIFGIDKDGAVNEWNQTASAITGYTREEVFGQNLVKKYINPENQDAVDEVLTNALRGTDTANFEFPLFTKDGRRVEILLNASARCDVSGNVVGVVGVGQDITSMK